MIRCPECNSTRLIKFGTKFARNARTGRRHAVQQYQCKNCGRITIKPRGA
jgi:DNA-directed RNA polymerase subunit RPC12/RpoP